MKVYYKIYDFNFNEMKLEKGDYLICIKKDENNLCEIGKRYKILDIISYVIYDTQQHHCTNYLIIHNNDKINNDVDVNISEEFLKLDVAYKRKKKLQKIMGVKKSDSQNIKL